MSEVDMLGPLDIHQYLLAHDVHHEIVRLPRPAASADHLADVLGVPPRRCLAIHPFHAMTPDGDVLVLVLAPAEAAPDLARVAEALADLLQDTLGPAASLTAAGAELVSSRTDYLAGHLAPLLLPAEVVVVATQGLADLAASIIYTATGDGGTALGIGALDLLSLTRARLMSDAAFLAGSVLPTRARWIELDPSGAPIDLDAPVRTAAARTASSAVDARRADAPASPRHRDPPPTLRSDRAMRTVVAGPARPQPLREASASPVPTPAPEVPVPSAPELHVVAAS